MSRSKALDAFLEQLVDSVTKEVQSCCSDWIIGGCDDGVIFVLQPGERQPIYLGPGPLASRSGQILRALVITMMRRGMAARSTTADLEAAMEERRNANGGQ